MLKFHGGALVCLIYAALATGQVSADPPADKSPSPAKARPEVLVDAGQSLFLFSERPEQVPEFFQRNRVVIGDLWQKELDKLSHAKEPTAKLFLSYTSANDDPEKAARYGDWLTLAPLPPEVAALIDKHAEPKRADGDRQVTLILRRDAERADLYHVVGLTTHSPVSFFTLKEKLKGDDFAPADLKYKAQ
jgi:hypothetical protein